MSAVTTATSALAIIRVLSEAAQAGADIAASFAEARSIMERIEAEDREPTDQEINDAIARVRERGRQIQGGGQHEAADDPAPLIRRVEEAAEEVFDDIAPGDYGGSAVKAWKAVFKKAGVTIVGPGDINDRIFNLVDAMERQPLHAPPRNLALQDALRASNLGLADDA